jgi:hypothetical protein
MYFKEVVLEYGYYIEQQTSEGMMSMSLHLGTTNCKQTTGNSTYVF